MALTDSQISLKLNTLEKSISDLQFNISKLTDDISSRTMLSDLALQEAELRQLISDNSKLIVNLERRLAQVLLPEDTRYYLEEGEVNAFKSNFSQLKAMMTRFERLYNNLVAKISTL